MFHKLARKHYTSLASQHYPLSLDFNNKSLTFLNLNINSFSDHPYSTYPSIKQPELAKEYIKVLKKLSYLSENTPFQEENILFTQGSSESIDLIMRVFCEPGKDSITVTSPTFPYYTYRANIENIPVLNVPLQGENLNILDTQKLSQSPSKVLFLCSPNNPVGTLLSLDQIQEVIESFSGIVVVDEAYIEWTDAPSVIKWVEKYDRLIVLRTFSKIWGLAGVRCGVTIAHPQLIETLHFSQTMFGFPTSSADLVLSQMKNVESILTYKSQAIPLRKNLFNFLQASPFTKKVFPGTANFLLAQFYDEKKVEQHLLKAGILVSNASQQLPGALRISIGSDKEMRLLEATLKCL